MEKLGSGTSLPGILAAKCGGDVTLSDSEDFPHCLENCRKSCQANGLSDIPVIGITWGRFNGALLHMSPVDVILGSDCFYDSKGWTLSLSSLFLFPLSLPPSLSPSSLSHSHSHLLDLQDRIFFIFFFHYIYRYRLWRYCCNSKLLDQAKQWGRILVHVSRKKVMSCLHH